MRGELRVGAGSDMGTRPVIGYGTPISSMERPMALSENDSAGFNETIVDTARSISAMLAIPRA